MEPLYCGHLWDLEKCPDIKAYAQQSVFTEVSIFQGRSLRGVLLYAHTKLCLSAILTP